MKRAVSPLIATILLVGLTISIGALIISWGKSYTSSKISCISYQLTVYQLTSPAADTLEVLVENIGAAPIDLENDNNLAFVLVLNDGSIRECSLGDTAPANGCIIQKVSGETLDPGEEKTLTIKLGSGLTADSVVKGYFKYGICGRISNEVIKT